MKFLAIRFLTGETDVNSGEKEQKLHCRRPSTHQHKKEILNSRSQGSWEEKTVSKIPSKTLYTPL